MRRASGSAIPLRSTSSSILTLRQAPTQWPQYTCPPDFLRGYLLGLILPYIAINLVVSTFIMTGVFRAIPKELLEAARTDGCTVLRTLVQILLPLCINGLIVVAMLNFIAMWGEFLLAYTLTSTSSARTLTVAMAQATAGTGVWEWPRIAAVYTVMIIPPIILFVAAQKWFMKGITEGALRQ